MAPLRRWPSRVVLALLLLGTLPALGACRTPGGGGGARVARAAKRALVDPRTWAPAAGALAIGLAGADEDVADWARRKTPLFGSRGDAATASDVLLATSGVLAAGTWWTSPTRGDLPRSAAEAGGVAATGGTALLLKGAVGRRRPDGSDEASFPSAHAALAASFGGLAQRAASRGRLRAGARTAVDVASVALPLATGWARMEAGAHHPVDVLAGMAIGNAVTVFVTEAAAPRPGRPRLRAGPLAGGAIGVGLSLER